LSRGEQADLEQVDRLTLNMGGQADLEYGWAG
jgi:hypothetical protein